MSAYKFIRGVSLAMAPAGALAAFYILKLMYVILSTGPDWVAVGSMVVLGILLTLCAYAFAVAPWLLSRSVSGSSLDAFAVQLAAFAVLVMVLSCRVSAWAPLATGAGVFFLSRALLAYTFEGGVRK